MLTAARPSISATLAPRNGTSCEDPEVGRALWEACAPTPDAVPLGEEPAVETGAEALAEPDEAPLLAVSDAAELADEDAAADEVAWACANTCEVNRGITNMNGEERTAAVT